LSNKLESQQHQAERDADQAKETIGFLEQQLKKSTNTKVGNQKTEITNLLAARHKDQERVLMVYIGCSYGL